MLLTHVHDGCGGRPVILVTVHALVVLRYLVGHTTVLAGFAAERKRLCKRSLISSVCISFALSVLILALVIGLGAGSHEVLLPVLLVLLMTADLLELGLHRHVKLLVQTCGRLLRCQ